MSTTLASMLDFHDPRLVTKHEIDALRIELGHQGRRLTSDLDYRFARLELKIESLQHDLSRAAEMRRQYVYLVLSVLFSGFLVALTFV